jgi:uracil-DNA glycosylase family 4
MEELADIQRQLRTCTRCQLAGYPVQGPPIFSGAAGARVMIVGQAPGRVEVGETHRPFSGSAGARLFRWLQSAGWSETQVRTQFYITSITKCFPGPNRSGRGDRAPSRAEQQLCSSWLEGEVTLVDPVLLIPVGTLAAARFFGSDRKLVDLVGQRFQIEGRIVIPLPHPSGASAWTQAPDNQVLVRQALAQLQALKQELNL